MNTNDEVMSGLIHTPQLYSTVRISLIDQDSNEAMDCLYDEAAAYCQDIAYAIEHFDSPQYSKNDLMQYFVLPEDKQTEQAIRRKIQSARLSVQSVGTKLYAKLELTMSSDLTMEELEVFTNQIESQFKDGWGAEFEMQNIKTNCSDIVCLRLFHDGLTFYTGNAFEASIAQEMLDQDAGINSLSFCGY